MTTRGTRIPPGEGRNEREMRVTLHPLAESRLALEVDRALLPAMRDALPLVGADWIGTPQAALSVLRSPVLPAVPPPWPPLARGTGAGAWAARGHARQLIIHADDGRVHGLLDLAARTGTLRVRADAGTSTPSLQGSLTLAASLLLGRLGRLTLCAGAIVPPDDGAWLLVGGRGTGKSSTCAALIAAGWDYVADEYVVVAPDGRVEGWWSDFRLDRGWLGGVETGERAPHDPLRLGTGRWRRAADVRGVLFPVVRPDEPTRLEPVGRADAFAALARECPALLADADAAPALVVLLEQLTHLPCRRLLLGRDVYASPARIAAVLAAR